MTYSGFGRVILASSVLLLAASLWGCGGSNQEKSLGGQDDGHEVTLQVGQTLAVSLEANPTTGYPGRCWRWTPPSCGPWATLNSSKRPARKG